MDADEPDVERARPRVIRNTFGRREVLASHAQTSYTYHCDWLSCLLRDSNERPVAFFPRLAPSGGPLSF
jgi:hypothetical protein